MITYSKLIEKFIDKGYFTDLLFFVQSPPLYDPTKLLIENKEENYKKFQEITQEVYGKDWDYWNTWIDHQNYK